MENAKSIEFDAVIEKAPDMEFLSLGLGIYRIRFIPTTLFMLLGTVYRFTIYALKITA